MNDQIPAPDLRSKSDEEIWTDLHHGMVGSPLHTQAKLTLELRNLERQSKASLALAKSTEGLVTATERLGASTRGLWVATWALVGVSALLLLATVSQIVLTWFKVK